MCRGSISCGLTMARAGPPFPSPNRALTASRTRPVRPVVQRLQPVVSIRRALAYLTLVGLGVLFLWLTLQVDLVIFSGVLLAICLRRAADGSSRFIKVPPRWAMAAIVLLLLAFFVAMGWFFSREIAGQIDQLSRQLPAAVKKIGTMIGQSSLGQTLTQHLNIEDIQTSPSDILKGFFGTAMNLVEVVGAVVVMLFLGVYFAAEAELYTNGLLRLVPPARRPRAAEILHETASAIWYWMMGRLFSMAVLGVLTALGLWVIGAPLPVALGFLAGILAFVPYIGAIASAIPSVLMAAAVNLNLAIYVVILYLGLHLIEGYLLVPLVQRRIVHLPPALTLSAQLLLGLLAGLLGLLLATPLVAAALVLVRMVYVEDVLGDRGSTLPHPAE
jgi:predicted PurR-regulated permease PerM